MERKGNQNGIACAAKAGEEKLEKIVSFVVKIPWTPLAAQKLSHIENINQWNVASTRARKKSSLILLRVTRLLNMRLLALESELV